MMRAKGSTRPPIKRNSTRDGGAAECRRLRRALNDIRRQDVMLPELLNKREIERLLGEVTDRTGIVYIDINGFKQINDKLSHDIGDAALRELAALLAVKFTRRGDRVGRVGGDEFLVLVDIKDGRRRNSPIHQLDNVVKRLREIEHTFRVWLNETYPATLKCGVGLAIGAVLSTSYSSLRNALLGAEKRMKKDKGARAR